MAPAAAADAAEGPPPSAGEGERRHLEEVEMWLEALQEAPGELLRQEAAATNQGRALALCVSRLRELAAAVEGASSQRLRGPRAAAAAAAAAAAQQETYLDQLRALEKAALSGTNAEAQGDLQQQQLNLQQVWELLDGEATRCIRRARKRLRKLRQVWGLTNTGEGMPSENDLSGSKRRRGARVSAPADKRLQQQQQKRQQELQRCIFNPEALSLLHAGTHRFESESAAESEEDEGEASVMGGASAEEETDGSEARGELQSGDEGTEEEEEEEEAGEEKSAEEEEVEEEEEGEEKSAEEEEVEEEVEEEGEEKSAEEEEIEEEVEEEVEGEEGTEGPASESDAEDDDAASAEADDLLDEIEGREHEKAQRDRSKKPKQHQLEDEFFSLEAMHRFVEEAEQEEKKQNKQQQQRLQRQRLQQQLDDEEESELDDEEAAAADLLLYEGIDPSAKGGGGAISYEAFYSESKGKEQSKRRLREHCRSSENEIRDVETAEESEEVEGELKGFASEGPLDAEDRRLEKELDRLQALMEEEDRERREQRRCRRKREEEEQEGSCGSSSEVDEAPMAAAVAATPPNRRKVRAGSDGSTARAAAGVAGGDDSLAALASRVEALEDELVAPKSWEFTGEAWGRHRSKDALLELEDLTVPFPAQPQQQQLLLQHQDLRLGEDDGDEETVAAAAAGASGSAVAISTFIERIVKGRIEEALFDDVQRKALPNKPSGAGSNKAGAAAAAAAEEELNMQKPAEGLGDLYAREYQEKLLGAPSQQQQQLDAEKRQLLELFGEVMYKCDALTNAQFVPRPVAALAGSAEGKGAPAAVRVEEAVPVFVPVDRSGNKGSLPETRKTAEETTQEERRAERRRKKEQRQKQLRKRIDSGELTLQQARDRQEHLQAKNKAQKVERAQKRRTGLTNAEAIKELRKGQKRVKTVQLLADAARAKAAKAHSSSSSSSKSRIRSTPSSRFALSLRRLCSGSKIVALEPPR
ncbi:trichohyalin-like [Cyclospora cayetanensis]|uniref:Trichohyalin-like n=1 Tax=Cyclospora cayetanensis TaxID=88456 RepID=A0A6P6RRH3_9EIME|nr:trichohyalin-like [Cyclospora cayetanensis]